MSEKPVPAILFQLIGLRYMCRFVAVIAVQEMLLTVTLTTLAFTVLQTSGGMCGKQSAHVGNANAGNWIVNLVAMILANAIFGNGVG